MKDQESCIFCKIAHGKVMADILFHDEFCTIFRDIEPQAPVHLLVIPNSHISSIHQIDAENKTLVGHIMTCIASIAAELNLDKEGYRVVTNCGSGAGQSVFHLHFHILSGRRFRWPPG